MHPIISVKNLSKVFSFRKSAPGIWGSLKSLFQSETEKIPAIRDLSFSIQPGERVAFIGPNGAGKSTTIKMLTGILYPTSGEIEVLNLTPWKQRKALGYQIGTVFGQRTQLWIHLPPIDTFDLLSKIYEIKPPLYQKRLSDLIEIFEIAPLLHKPVRQLSLGERMRCELVASLLHQPRILFLDEPTIGLDINAKLKIRDLLNRLSKEQGTTLFLTSHDTADIEKVCDRVMILDQGSLILDNPLKELKKRFAKKRTLTLITDQERLALNLPGLKILENSHHQFICEIQLDQLTMEEIIQTLYRSHG